MNKQITIAYNMNKIIEVITITEVIGYDFDGSDDCHGNDYGDATLITIFIYSSSPPSAIIKIIATLIAIIKVIITTNTII